MTINEWSDATAMAEAVQNKMVSPRELVKDTISEAQRTNTKTNVIVSQRYEKALVEAENRDFSDKPFSGVPIFLKDLGQEQAGESLQQQVLAYLQVTMLKKRITMSRSLKNWASLFQGVLALLSLVSKISVMPRFMVLSICLTM